LVFQYTGEIPDEDFTIDVNDNRRISDVTQVSLQKVVSQFLVRIGLFPLFFNGVLGSISKPVGVPRELLYMQL
jgi:hypothetical protein